MTPAHLSDDRLIEVCLLEVPSAVEQQHLGSCARCDVRRARLQSLRRVVVKWSVAAYCVTAPLCQERACGNNRIGRCD